MGLHPADTPTANARTISGMTTPLRSSVAAALLIYAISALVPPVWPCPIDWERLPLATYVRCAVALDNVPEPCDRVAPRPRAIPVSCPAPACARPLAPCPTYVRCAVALDNVPEPCDRATDV